MADSCYTLIPADDKSEQPTLAQLKTQLETGDEEMKIQTMKKILTMMLNGEPLPQLLMFVIRFVVPSKNKTLKKLLLLYWEVSQKKNPDGKLKQEFILVCNALRNDLQHPNEYIRGTTLRFICKLREPEILEPLVPSIRACLEHRHTYVRRNAILSIFSIYKHMDYLMPDAPDVIYNYLLSESDMSCKRNAFIMLYNCDQGRAVEFLSSVIDQVVNYGESLQLTIIDLIRKVWKTSPSEKPKFLRCIYELLNSSSSAVKYESASVLTSLSSAPTSIKAAAACYINLIVKESDNNVKLIVLDRISELREKHGRVLDDQVMDVLRVLASPDIEVRKKCLKISLEMVSSKNVSEVVSFLKKEISKTHDQDYEKNAEYRQLLIQSIHSCAIKFSEVAGSVVHTLMEFISDTNVDSAVEVVKFVKEVVERFPNLRKSLTDKLIECLSDIKDSRVYSGSLWVLGEYCSDEESIEECFNAIRRILGEVPIVEHELKNAQAIAEKMKEEAAPVTSGTLSTPVSRVVVLPDGTYSTQSALSNESALSKQLQVSKKTRPLRSLLLEGDFYLADIFSSSITKLALKYASCCKDSVKVNKLASEVMLTLTSILRLGKSEIVQNPIDPDSYERIVGCLRALMEPSSITTENFLNLSRQSFTNLLESRKSESSKKDEVASRVIHAEESIYFRHLKAKKNEEIEDQHEVDLNKATGAGESDDLLSKLSRIVQLTGHSDPVYAEAYVNVHQYDILLDVLIVNQTTDTLQNLSLELATLGDLKLTERPSLHNLGPHDFLNIKANIKVSSTETGVIFGNIVYDRSGSVDSNVIIMNDIHIDIMDYIQPAYCEEKQFLDMWSEFEWENKVNVVTTIEDLRDYLNHILKMTNMASLTPKSALEGDCAFLSANLYARSIFGEDALANISIEKTPQGKIVGHIRIRSKTQGIALSLGEKINQTQRSLPEQ